MLSLCCPFVSYLCCATASCRREPLLFTAVRERSPCGSPLSAIPHSHRTLAPPHTWHLPLNIICVQAYGSPTVCPLFSVAVTLRLYLLFLLVIRRYSQLLTGTSFPGGFSCSAPCNGYAAWGASQPCPAPHEHQTHSGPSALGRSPVSGSSIVEEGG